MAPELTFDVAVIRQIIIGIECETIRACAWLGGD